MEGTGSQLEAAADEAHKSEPGKPEAAEPPEEAAAAAPEDAISEAEREALLAELKGLQADLHQMQGERPLILPTRR